MDPTHAFSRVTGDVHILHGHGDHLIPFTESCRLHQALERARVRLTITRLFAHSGQERFRPWATFKEVPRFAAALAGVLGMV